jgi:hypothetical protein
MLLKVGWSRGGATDDVDGLARIRGAEFEPVLSVLLPGDFLLLGNNGTLSHVAVYVGAGEIVHSMATEKTMRGLLGSFWDAMKRPFRWVWGIQDECGVIVETLVGFVDRFERDTAVVVRVPDLPEPDRARGVAHVRTLVGSTYDYAFTADDDDYYCTEIVVEFLRLALETPPVLQTKRVRVPLLLDVDVVEPIAVLHHPDLRPVLANRSAMAMHGELLPGVDVFGV